VKAMAVGDAERRVAVTLNPKDRGGTTVSMADAEAGSPSAACRPLLDVLAEEGIAWIDALKIDTECTEDFVLAPFFRDASPSLWPDMVIIEDSRHAWRTDVIALMLQRGYAIAARSKHNLVLRRAR